MFLQAMILFLLLLLFPNLSQQDCSTIQKCDSCSEEQCGGNCYESGFLGVFNGKCHYRKIHGGWSGWSSWGTCSSTCGYGVKQRSRSCNNPSPRYQGNSCSGSSKQSTVCPENPYCKDCDISHGSRTYINTYTTSAYCGSNGHCFEKEDLGGNQKCYYKKVHGQWSIWGNWSKCSPICGAAWRIRRRTCTNPAPAYHGDNCYGDNHEYTGCELKLVKNGFPYVEKSKYVARRNAIAESVTKIQCVLKCQNRKDCVEPGFQPSPLSNRLGTCYSILNEETGMDETIQDNRQEIYVYEIPVPAKPGTAETANLRGFC